jgi:hypothetical protein
MTPANTVHTAQSFDEAVITHTVQASNELTAGNWIDIFTCDVVTDVCCRSCGYLYAVYHAGQIFDRKHTRLLASIPFGIVHFPFVYNLVWAGIVTCYGMDGPGIESRWR